MTNYGSVTSSFVSSNRLKRGEFNPCEIGSYTLQNEAGEEQEFEGYPLSLFYQRCYSNSKSLTSLKSIPNSPPARRFKRHRDPRFRMLNDIRHFWKTSRLLVRLAGAYVWCRYMFKWNSIVKGQKKSVQKKAFKTSLKAIKTIGRGGSSERFLNDVHPMTRTLRIVMAVGRAVEASIDNRFWEVLFAEAMAFMGNRSARWWVRHITDSISKRLILPTYFHFFYKSNEFMTFLEIVIIIMGLIRAIAPFASSFIGSRIGRQVTLMAVDRINLRWKPCQNIHDLVIDAGSYQPLKVDAELEATATNIAKAVGHGKDPVVVRKSLQLLDFEVVGSGKGGYSMYRKRHADGLDHTDLIYLHITPFGPSILDEMPRFIVLEKTRKYAKELVQHMNSSLHGFLYSGAYFTNQEWAALKQRHDEELEYYDQACKYMGRRLAASDTVHMYPPIDLLGLKAFNRSGRPLKKRRKDKKQFSQITHHVNKLSKKIKYLISRGKAPSSVIIYMEGLDCAGKSSTGGLISNVLEKAGYHLEHAQYNKAPTEEERTHPWMWRFAKPSLEIPSSIVWDRGPAGDFVYGNLDELSKDEKQEHYHSFERFEQECISESILFLKILFISSKDSIAKTLGKRLAHKKIVRDLHTWLDANSITHDREGLNEIENHIDPTDFAAVNKYDSNLRKFYDFALQTDHLNLQTKSVYNPWMVISTSNRHQARLEIMSEFEKRLIAFRKVEFQNQHHLNIQDELESSLNTEFHEHVSLLSNDMSYEGKKRKLDRWVGIKEAFPSIVILVMIAYSYLHQTWKVDYFWQ